ncbi:hypothetical protein CTI12_AA329980 [Artemisia annua]|uniref:Uncharacterized protein n=1 Tax=Artemisia annua TaxID=35608 RepID=A0A2U1MWN2_ARTAN|nr:hypothetical protein CTI12_AA329980 [Artemisia annua]
MTGSVVLMDFAMAWQGYRPSVKKQTSSLIKGAHEWRTANNAGAILVIGRGLVVVPKLIHPLPPPLEPETSPEYVEERHWMQATTPLLMCSALENVHRGFANNSLLQYMFHDCGKVV